MKILITGSAGMLGSTMYPILKDKGHEVRATDINTEDKEIQYLDVRDINQMFKFVNDFQPDIILHLAAKTDLEECELDADQAFMTNTIGVQNCALVCQKRNIPMVYISTAGVFDGKKDGAYTEFDTPNPINVYGKSKLEGEKMVQSLLQKYFIVRAGWMIGGGKKDKKFVAKIIQQIKDGKKELFVVSDKIGTPTYTTDFSHCLGDLILTDYYGLYHMACGGEGTRYDVAEKILEFLGRKDIKLSKVNSDFFSKDYFVPRSPSEMMRNLVLDLRGLNKMRPWEVSLREYLEINFKEFKNKL